MIGFSYFCQTDFDVTKTFILLTALEDTGVHIGIVVAKVGIGRHECHTVCLNWFIALSSSSGCVDRFHGIVHDAITSKWVVGKIPVMIKYNERKKQ